MNTENVGFLRAWEMWCVCKAGRTSLNRIDPTHQWFDLNRIQSDFKRKKTVFLFSALALLAIDRLIFGINEILQYIVRFSEIEANKEKKCDWISPREIHCVEYLRAHKVCNSIFRQTFFHRSLSRSCFLVANDQTLY